jgi:hypothetical protein
MLIKRLAITVKANSRMVNVGLYCSSAGISWRILSMAGRLDLLLARKVEDLRQRVFELAAIMGRPMRMIPTPSSGRARPSGQ